jgi:uncharacterized protein (UPF0332 family)
MNGALRELMAYRISQADESLEAAELLFNTGKYRSSVNRAYYAMFYAVLALLVCGDHSISKHAGVISLFDREFVKTGIVDKTFSRWLHEAFELRQRTDYAEMYYISKERANEVVHNACEFVREMRQFLNGK